MSEVTEQPPMLQFDRRDLCTHKWRTLPQIDLRDPGRYLPPVSQCRRCDWRRNGHPDDLPKFGVK